MASQEMVSTLKIRTFNQVLAIDRPTHCPIAYKEGTAITLGEFRHLVVNLISKIQSCPAKRWALCFNDSYYFSASLLAVWYCQKVAIIPGHLRQNQLIAQCDTFDALLTDLSLSVPKETLFLPLQENLAIDVELPKWSGEGQLILFTSGSTGEPKEVKKTTDQFLSEIELIAQQWLEQLHGGVIAATVSHQHMYGLTFRIMLPLLVGIPFHTHLINYHEQLFALAKQPVTLITSPAYLKRLDIKLPQLSCRKIFSAGGPLTFSEAQNIKLLLGSLPQEIYGTTETGVIAARSQHMPEQLWQPFPSIDISQQTDETIYVVSPLLHDSTGIQINDVIRLYPDGFQLISRKDRIIKIEEKRISLNEVEQFLLRSSEIIECAVIALQQDSRIILGAVIVLSEQGQNKFQQQGKFQFTRQLRQELRNGLESVAIPRRWRIVTSLPQNSQGKRSQIELQELFYEAT